MSDGWTDPDTGLTVRELERSFEVTGDRVWQLIPKHSAWSGTERVARAIANFKARDDE